MVDINNDVKTKVNAPQKYHSFVSNETIYWSLSDIIYIERQNHACTRLKGFAQ